MALDVASVIGDCVLSYRDMTRPMALAYLQQVYDDLAKAIRLTSDVQDIALQANVRLYALDANVVKIYYAELYRSDTDTIGVELTSVRAEERYTPRFRGSIRGNPQEVYQEASSTGARQIGVYPIPDTSAVLSYPTLRLWVSRRLVITDSGAVYFPESIKDSSVLVAGVLWKHAKLRHQDEADKREANWMKEKAALMGDVTNLLIDVQPRNDPRIGSIFRQY